MKTLSLTLALITLSFWLSSTFAEDYLPSRNLDPNYQPVTFSDYQATHPESETAIREISVSTNRDFSNFLIIVDSDLYPEVNQSILTYQENLEQDEINAFLLTFSGTRCSDLRNLLTAYYQSYNIMGAMLVGDLPLAWYELFEDWNHSGEQDNGEGWAEFPMDIYYTDLDGEWIDSNENGIYDEHTGNTEPEIILGRIKADNLDLLQQTEAELVNNYFSKNNQFRQGDITSNSSALLYLDDGWYHHGDDTTEDLECSFDDVVFVNDSLTTCAADYSERLTQNYDLIQVNVHSNPHYHQFEPAPFFWNEDLVNTLPNALFYNLFACSNVNLAVSNNMGSIYLLDNDYTQAVLGSTKSGGILYTEELYQPIFFGYRMGDNFKDWWIEHVDTGSDTTWQRAWFYGLTYLGDPCIRLKNMNGTYVSGSVSGFWSADDSPYIALENITIEAGETLEIEAGCEIQFLTNKSFTINGQLIAEGTVTDSIYFTQFLNNSPWQGLSFIDCNWEEPSLLFYASITNCAKSVFPIAKGGGIYQENSSLKLNNILIRNCVASIYGGGLYSDGSPLQTDNVTITHCTSNNYGGGLALSGDNQTIISNIDISNCDADRGGGVAIVDGNINISDINMTNNRADAGGALYIKNSVVIATNIKISHNIAEVGGGIYLYEDSSLGLNSSKIISNKSKGIYSQGSLTIASSTIADNYSENTGGGLDIGCYSILEIGEAVSIYNNTAALGADLYFGDEDDYYNNWTRSVVLDTFTVQNPTQFHIYPMIDDFSADHFMIEQSYDNFYVSPQGSNENSGLTPEDPFKNLYEVSRRSYPTISDSNQTIYLSSGIFSYNENADLFPIVTSGNTKIIGSAEHNTQVLPNNFLVLPINNYDLALENLHLTEESGGEIYGLSEIEISNGNLSIENVTFSSYNLKRNVIRAKNSNVLLNNTTVEMENNWNFWSSSFLFYNSSVEINNSNFINLSNPYHTFEYNNSEIIFDNILFDNVQNPIFAKDCVVDLSNVILKNINHSFIFEDYALIDLNKCKGRLSAITIKDNFCGTGAISIEETLDSLLIKDCVIYNNISGIQAGLRVINSGKVVLENITIKDNLNGNRASLELIDSDVIFSRDYKCNIFNNVSSSPPFDISTNINTHVIVDTFTTLIPTAQECLPLDMFTFEISNIPSYNIENCDTDLYVSPTGNDSNSGTSPFSPLKSISLAVSKINPSEENPLTIHLMDGVYSSGEDCFPLHLKSNLTIKGSGIDNTELSSYSLTNFVLENLVNVNIENLSLRYGAYYSAGIIECANSELSVENVLIHDCYGRTAPIVLTNSNGTFINVTWNDNYSNISGIQGIDSSIRLIRCSFKGSINGWDNNTIDLVNANFKAFNSVFAETGHFMGPTTLLTSEDSDLEFYNCVFDYAVNNEDGRMYLKNGDITIKNSIISSFYGFRFINYLEDTSSDLIDIDYNCFTNNDTLVTYTNATYNFGSNNLIGFDQFNNSYLYDFNLIPDSPCIDAGDPNWWNDPEDYDEPGFALYPALGTTRADMGIYGGRYCLIPEDDNHTSENYDDTVPTNTSMLSNYPNPFNPSTEIRFQFADLRDQNSDAYEQDVKIEIYNIKGQRIRELAVISAEAIHGEMERSQATTQSVTWNARDNQGKQVSSGVYLYSLKVGNKIKASRKMLLLK